MASNHNKLKISGNVIKTDRVSEDDYSNGINSEDQMINVRFESTEEGLKAIYNAALVISLIPESNNSSRIQNTSESIVNLGGFSHYLGETYKLTENMQVTDDKDGEIDVDKITATIQKGLERHELIFGGRNRREQDLPAFKLKLVEQNNKPKINFEALINDRILATSKSNYDYYGVEIFRDTENTGVRNRLVEVKVGVQDNTSNESFNMRNLVSQDLEYGDKIKIYTKQTPNFRIKGEILGDVKEDYSDGVQNKRACK